MSDESIRAALVARSYIVPSSAQPHTWVEWDKKLWALERACRDHGAWSTDESAQAIDAARQELVFATQRLVALLSAEPTP